MGPGEEETRSGALTARFVSLWLSQAARVFADGCLRLLAMLAFAAGPDAARLSAWHLATTVFILPFVLLAPLNGCLSNALPRRWVLSASAGLCFAGVALRSLFDGSWASCLAVVAIGAAVNSAARYAMLPAAARDTDVPLPRLSGWIELGAAGAVVASVAIGLLLPQHGWPGNGEPLAWRATLVLAGVNLLSFLASLPAAFPSDTRRPERPLAAIAGFFRDTGRIGGDRRAAWSLLALAGFQALVTAGAGALVAGALARGDDGVLDLLRSLVFAGLGTAVGSGVAALVAQPRRSLGLVPLGAVGLVVGLGWALLLVAPDEAVPAIPCLLLGFNGGLLNAPLRAAFLAAIPADARGNGTAVMNTAIYTATALLCGLVVGLIHVGWLPTARSQLALLGALALAGAVSCLWALLGPLVELLLGRTRRIESDHAVPGRSFID